MANRRVYYAIKAVAIAPHDTIDWVTAHGVQSVGLTTTFNLEQVFELGQLAIYENVEGIPDVEMTMEKVIDGYPLLMHLSTRFSPSTTLSGRSNQRCNVAMAIFGDTQDSASGVAQAQVEMSGMYWSSSSFTFPSEGSCTESITLVGNNKVWKTANLTYGSGNLLFDNTDEPLALTSGTGGVQRRENVIFDSNSVTLDENGMMAGTDATILPPDIDGISTSGTNDKDSEGQYGSHISQITVNVDLGRDNIVELGRKAPYYRFVNFPVEVTCDVETITTRGDLVDAREDAENLTNRTIKIKLEESTHVDLGTKNRLSTVTYGGGDTSGGQASVTYSYSNFNDFIVSHDQDPG